MSEAVAVRTARLPRSWLFVPADSERKLQRVMDAGADAVILDLEDAVSVDRKGIARDMAMAFLRAHGTVTPDNDKPALWVRINSLSSGLMVDDVRAVLPCSPAGLLLPKAKSPADVCALDHLMTELEASGAVPAAAIMALVTETAVAVANLPGYAREAEGRARQLPARLCALTWGGEDLACELGALVNREVSGEGKGEWRFTYQLVRSLCQLAAAAAGVPAVETIYADFRDSDALGRHARRAVEDGFSGMLAIHPDQVAVINAAFTPSAAQLDEARRVLAAFAAADPGSGAVQLDGRMLDRPHRVQAEQMLRRAR